ncbi:MAG: ComF family protein [Chlorobium sp.]|nr:ComF family protein [Chlorobium phaeovibrioides]NQU46319.1 ComF family protein [Chlorobium sp.]
MFDQLLHLLLPNVCAVCSRLLMEDESGFCKSCRAEFDPFALSTEGEGMLRSTIAARFGSSFSFERGWCRYLFHKKSPLQSALHSMKYGGLFSLGRVFGRELGELVAASGSAEGIDCVVPVPLHPLKKIERTYNQSEVIARPLAEQLERPILARVLRRNHFTRSQTGLSAVERRANLEGAFKAEGDVRGMHVLLVDDVVTTGSTMAAASGALLEAGAARISLASVALALKE